MKIKPIFLFKFAPNDFRIIVSKFFGYKEYDASWFAEKGVSIVEEPCIDIQQEEVLCKSEDDALEELSRLYAKQFMQYHIAGLSEAYPEMSYQDFVEHLLSVLGIKEIPIKLEP